MQIPYCASINELIMHSTLEKKPTAIGKSRPVTGENSAAPKDGEDAKSGSGSLRNLEKQASVLSIYPRDADDAESVKTASAFDPMDGDDEMSFSEREDERSNKVHESGKSDAESSDEEHSTEDYSDDEDEGVEDYKKVRPLRRSL